VYADTWAHQRFSGIPHKINSASGNRHINWSLWDSTQSAFVRHVSKLGHGAVLTHPDLPFLRWEYKDGYGTVIQRDNPAEFLTACKRIFYFYSCYRDAEIHELQPRDEEVIASSLKDFNSLDAWTRQRQWLRLAKGGCFSFGTLTDSEMQDAVYLAKGKGSWKFLALGTESEQDSPDDVFPYTPAFETSNWKLFHDALKEHQREVLYEILPLYQLPISDELARSARHEDT
jgi:hypothetical protein